MQRGNIVRIKRSKVLPWMISKDSCYYAQTEYCGRPESFLDYTFLSHREMIYGKKTKDPKKLEIIILT